ncbi:MAG TPA: peptidylprolyl isomerase [Acidimicrobiales bacterium]|nr:peptidylprolyl isomerase [Acidimicrobiales bacterium]
MKEQKTRNRNRLILRVVVIGAITLGAVVLYNAFSGGSSDSTDTTAATAAAHDATTVPPDTATASDNQSADVDTPIAPECPAFDGSSPRHTQFTGPPPTCIDESAKYVAHFTTNDGEFDVLIDPAMDPVSANNFIFLALWHAYDGTTFHRVINQFMIQGGDVQDAGGIGTPGYRFTGGEPAAGEYRVGSLAMANSGDSSSNGSQFFIVTGDAGVGLPPLYSLFGQVIDGIDVPLAIQETQTDPSDRPVEDVVVESIEIREAGPDDIAAYEAALNG